MGNLPTKFIGMTRSCNKSAGTGQHFLSGVHASAPRSLAVGEIATRLVQQNQFK